MPIFHALHYVHEQTNQTATKRWKNTSRARLKYSLGSYHSVSSLLEPTI